MARVTVEDCTEIVKNRFELVVLASRRARDIASGSDIKVSRDNDKDAVVSLREIADKKISPEELKEEIIASYRDRSKYSLEDQEVSAEVKEALAEDAQVVDDSKSQTDAGGMFAEDNVQVND